MESFPSAAQLLEIRQQFEPMPPPSERRWEYFQAGEDQAVILPTSRPPALFRGQHTRYSPSRTALARALWSGSASSEMSDLNLRGLATLVRRLALRLWFCKELEAHPGSNWLKQNKLRGFEFALAQHYGIPTGYMDLSESFDVSCFFATCQLGASGEWLPCVEGQGVMYLLPTERIPIRPDVLQPIGLQVLPRPREQFGWVIVCGIGSDFEDIPGLQLFEFSHREDVSRYFLERFSGGRDLFPCDAMAEVADRIMESKVLPEPIVQTVVRDLCGQTENLSHSPSDIFSEIVSGLGFTLEDAVGVFDSDLRSQAEREWNTRSTQLLRNVGFSIMRSR